MKNIYLTLWQKEKLEPLSNKSHGYFGQCYSYKDGVLKIFSNKIGPITKRAIEKNIKRESNIILYPKCKAYIFYSLTPVLSGYYLDKAPGYALDELIEKIKNKEIDVSFDDFLTAYYDKFLKQLKKEDVILYNVGLEHIFFDEGFYLIDTDSYEDKPTYMSNREKNRSNIYKINSYLNLFANSFKKMSSRKLPSYDDEKFLEKRIKLIRKFTNNEVDSFGALADYHFIDSQINGKGIVIK